MNRLIEGALKNRQITLLLAFFILCMGIYYYDQLPKQENPETSSPAARIITLFPGASPEDVESLVTIPIEDGVREVDGIEKVESHSYGGYSVVIVFLNYDTDKEAKWSLIRDKLNDVEKTLPEGTMKPDMDSNLTESAGLILSVSGEKYDYETLSYFAEDIKRELERVEGVKRFVAEGEVEKEVVISVDYKKLSKYQVSLSRISDVLKAQNVSIPSGTIDTEQGKLTVQTNGTFETLRDIENLILDVSKETGGIVRVKDLAEVSLKEKEGSSKFKQDGENAVIITGFFEENKNIVKVGKEVRTVLEEIKKDFPSDLHVGEVLFLPEDVGEAVEDFNRNLLMAIGFVILVILVGMGVRNAIVVAAAIPLSIMATFDMMHFMHIDIQQISIAALIVALGMLVDNAIVISDAIQVKLNDEIPVMTACLEAAKEQSVPVLTSTLTTIAAFAPLTTLHGEAGEFVYSLPMVVMIALIASYLVAMLVTPVIGKYIFRKKKEEEKEGILRRFFGKGLSWSLAHKKMTMLISVLVFAGSLFLIRFTTINLFPYVDKDILYIDVYNETKGDIESTEKLMDKIAEILEGEKGILQMTTSVGRALPRFYMTVSTYPPSQDYGQILLYVNNQEAGFSSREEMAYQIEKRISQQIAGGKAFVKLIELNEPGHDVEVSLLGENREKTAKLAGEIEGILQSMESTKNISKDVSPQKYGYFVNINEDKTMMSGLTKYDVQKQINIALYGEEATVFRKEGNEYGVRLKTNIDSAASLGNLTLFSDYTGQKTLLKQIAEVTIKEEEGALKRLDGQESYTITTNIKPGFSVTKTQGELETAISKLDTRGVTISYGGDKEVFDKYVKSIGVAAVFAVFIIYMILLFQFGSAVQPLIILGTIPLSFVGSILGMVLFRQEVTLTVLLGVASLVGIVVNNAILLVDYINKERKQGKSIQEACKNSAGRRLRPILLSTTTTIIGLVPLAFWGSSFIKPMAVALMNGLGVATLLTLIVIPTMYALFIKES